MWDTGPPFSLILLSMSKVIELKDLEPKLSETVIFGGSFDPVHQGHVSVVKLLVEKFNTVLIAPTAQNPWKERKSTSLELRLEMLELVMKAEGLEDQVELCQIEYEFSEDLLLALRDGSEENYSYWAIGEDSAKSVSKWRNWDSLKLTAVVAPIEIDIHSTEIRKGQETAHPALKEFIADQSLY